jgi:hypothetical protein
VVGTVHDALRSTRGAAVAVAEIDAGRGTVRYCGLGNIVGATIGGESSRRLVTHNGTAGQGTPRVAEFTYPWEQGMALVMHSDGLQSRWDINSYDGLSARHPGLIAGVLYRDFLRGRDDATVVVVRGVAV